MIIPQLVPDSIHLDLKKNELILDLAADDSLILTTTTLYLVDSATSTIIALHRRSEESLEKHGKNVRFQRFEDLVIVQTDQDFLQLYTVVRIHNTNRDELLTVYTQSSNLLQNGLVQQGSNGFAFFSKEDIEEPILKTQLRFKLFLKIGNGIVDFSFISKHEILAITRKNVCILSLNDEKTEMLEFQKIEDKIISVTHKDDLFVVFTESNEAYIYQRSNKSLDLIVDNPFKNITAAAINSDNKLIVLSSDKRLIYFNYSVQKILKELTLEDTVKSINWSFDLKTLIVLFDSGFWALLSTFGSKYFDSKPHSEFNEFNWLSEVSSISLHSTNSHIYISTSKEIFKLRLLSTQLSSLNNTINHNQKRPILVSGSNLQIYSGYEMLNMSSSSSKGINWNILNIPFQHYHQINDPGISLISISTDSKFLAISNGKALLLHSTVDNDWSFYINDYNHDMNIKFITWFDKLNLLILINETVLGSELIIFDFKKFDRDVNFDSNYIVFKYDFNLNNEKAEVDDRTELINIVNNDLLVLTKKKKVYYFRFELLTKNFKIDLVKTLSLQKYFKIDAQVQNIIKVNDNDLNNDDFLIQADGELLYLKQLQNRSFSKNLLFDKVEYIHKINHSEYYLFNGENTILIKNFNDLVEHKDVESSILSIPLENQYPILLILTKGLIVTLENEFINKKQIQLNNIITKNSLFLHDLIKFELSLQSHEEVFHKYYKYKNFPYALELLLYRTISDEGDHSKLAKLIKVDPLIELHTVSKCLRKTELAYWKDLFSLLEITSEELLNRSIELKQFKILGILIIIFLNYDQINDNEHVSDYKLEKDESKLIMFLKLIFENSAQDDELWETGLELLRFLKLLDPSGELLKKSRKALEPSSD